MEKSSVSLIQRLSILRFCVKSWKGESESQIKYCLGTTVGMVERFITIQNFGQLTALRWNSRWIFPRVHRSAALQESPRVGDPSQFNGRLVFMLMFNDILWRSENNEPNAMLTKTLCIFTKRFPEGRWSFLGLGSETKCLPRTKKDHEKSGFVISEQLILEQSVEIFEGVSHQLVKFFIETIVAGRWWTSHQSFACKGLCVLIFCVMFWEYAPELAIKYLLFGNTSWVGSYIHQNTELWTIDGEPMKFEWNISKDSPQCSSCNKSKSSWEKWANPNNSKDELSSCRCSMTSYAELQTMWRNVLLAPYLCLDSQKDIQQDVGHSSDLDK